MQEVDITIDQRRGFSSFSFKLALADVNVVPENLFLSYGLIDSTCTRSETEIKIPLTKIRYNKYTYVGKLGKLRVLVYGLTGGQKYLMVRGRVFSDAFKDVNSTRITVGLWLNNTPMFTGTQEFSGRIGRRLYGEWKQ